MQVTDGIEVAVIDGAQGWQAWDESVQQLDVKSGARLELVAMDESEAQRTQRLLGTPYVLSLKNSAERRCIEAGRIAADLSFSRYKANQMRRDEDWRALVAQVQFGDAQ